MHLCESERDCKNAEWVRSIVQEVVYLNDIGLMLPYNFVSNFYD